MSAPANAPLSGAREARPSILRRLVARVAARDLVAFVVPGPDVARARGFDLEAAGLRVADTPRHASVLVLAGELPPGLKKAAAIAFAQMPRPRAILAVGAGDVSPLPGPDVSVEGDALGSGVEELRRLFVEGAFTEEADGFDVDEIRTRTEYACPMHPEVTSAEPGSCPRCGMDLVPREAAGGASHDHEEHGHSGHGSSDQSGSGHEEHGSHAGMAHAGVGHEEGSDGHEHGDQEGHGDSGRHGHMEHSEQEGHGGMDHGGGMGFMSMVEMTQGTPRSSDGLQMEWADAPFGPLFPGLPGGLSLTFTLDGDTVAGVEAMPGVEGWGPEGRLDGGSARDFPDRLALIDPLSPVAYSVLAHKALEDAAGAGERTALARVGALELERAASHLGWLSGLGRLLGYPWLEARAGRLQLALLWAEDADELARLAPEAGKLRRRILRTPLLARRLKGVGVLSGSVEVSGPVVRARGVGRDARDAEEAYRSLRFEPVVREGDDALARLRVRLAEVEESLGLVRRAGSVSVPPTALPGEISGMGEAEVETPRGTARLRVTLEDGVVSSFELDTPSTRHMGLVGAVAEGRELADALVGVASLDLSPWAVAR
ncbi:MAG: hypothetical protein M3P37_14735 [Actinomycetota bacterium]|nr:hypothetical protein [Actinomycetota bacterium]